MIVENLLMQASSLWNKSGVELNYVFVWVNSVITGLPLLIEN